MGIVFCSEMCLQQIAVSEASSLNYSFVVLIMKDFTFLAALFQALL